MFNKIGLILQLSIFLWLNTGNSQNSNEYLSWFDQKVSPENTALYNGYLDDGEGDFERTRSFKNTQRYFKSYDFLNGSITYEGQTYTNQQIKYDLYQDELLLNLTSSRGSMVKVKPIKHRIDGFNLAGHKFISLSNFNDSKYEGFAEKKFTGSNFIFFTKYKKTRSERVVEKKVMFEYYESNYNLLYFKGNLHLIKRKKDLIKLFPEFKKEMKDYAIHNATAATDILNYLTRLNSLLSKKQ
ncbi:hypothetical protein JBL43_11835 [Aureibaculum sp. A20]|uniref:Uncharacterized protein n=2 Tax=Aureibaculum flavum TaxID=2795986 RepID=A0ABS0WSH1_9FLAO|nr:hypothetical protein [Aureibaculum flavum]